MSRKLKSNCIIALILAFFAGATQAQSETKLSLDQIQNLGQQTLSEMRKTSLKNEQKKEIIRKRKSLIEKSLRNAILDGSATPDDLHDKKSALSEAFRISDSISALDLLQVEGGQFTRNSCLEAESLIRMGTLRPGQESPSPSEEELEALSLLQSLCH